jgi:hypothetical protein
MSVLFRSGYAAEGGNFTSLTAAEKRMFLNGSASLPEDGLDFRDTFGHGLKLVSPWVRRLEQRLRPGARAL